MNVLVSGLLERGRSDRPWKFLGALLVLVAAFCDAWNCLRPLSLTAYSNAWSVWQACIILAGFLATFRDSEPLRSAMATGIKVALIGSLPDLTVGLLWLLGIVHPTILHMHPSADINSHGHALTLWSVGSDAVVHPFEFLFLLLSCILVMGAIYAAIGAWLGVFLREIKTGYQKPT